MAHTFLRHHRDEIIRVWECAVAADQGGVRLAGSALRDHLADFLDELATWLEGAEPPGGPGMRAAAARHAATRLTDAYQLGQLISEFRVLRTTMLRLLREAKPTIRANLDDSGKEERVVELARLNAGLDYAITDAVEEFVSRETAQRKEAESALRGSEERFRALVAATSDVLYRMSADWGEMRQLHSKGAFLADTEAPTTSWVEKYIHPDDQRRVKSAIDEAIRTGSTFELEHRVLRVDGTLGWTFSRAIPVKDASGTILEWFGAATDITDRKRAEAAIRESEQRLRSVLENMAEGLVIFDTSGNITQQNPASVRIHDRSLSGEHRRLDQLVVHWRVREYPDGSLVPPEQWAIPRVLRGERVQGELFFVDCIEDPARSFVGIYSGCQVHDVWGGLAGGFLTIQDITEQARAAAALRDANEKLVEADRRKNEFLGVLSHELRNPLSPIRNAIHILKRAPDGSEQAARAKAVIERQTNQLSRLVDDILDVTRISRGKTQLNRSRFELTELLRHVVEDHRAPFDSRDIGLRLRIDVGPQWIDADSARIAQVIGNLLHNAAKFTNAHGHVVVTVARERPSQVTVHVTDDGIGMAPDMLRRVFEPFAQADESLHRSRGGLGLGLALVKALIEMHEGQVEVSSGGPGKGADFSVSLPVLPDAGIAPAAPSDGQVAVGHLRALIIEDNLDAAETLKEVMEMEGHEVSVVHDGREGVVKAHELGPDVVLCDIGLPGVDGYEVARQIRADRSISPTLIALTGYTRAEDQRKTFKAGFDHHLGKPVPIAELVKLLATISAHRTARRILIVDDNDALRHNLRELLEEEGWEVRGARNGEEAVEVASGFAPAVILLDYRLPGMDGGEVLRRLGALHAAPRVVLMTASAQVREIALEQGLRFYVPKPFNSDELLDTVEHARSGS